MNHLAPIAIFTYIRLRKLKKIINSLKKNRISTKSEIFIFSDGAKNKFDLNKVNRVRKYLKTINGFKKKNLIFRKKNLGNGDNIINGVTEVLKKNKKIIVVEDDLEIKIGFLTFMNACLNKYYLDKKVWHVGAWNFDLNKRGDYDIFFSKIMNCWGWGTWANRWIFFKKNPDMFIKYFDRFPAKKKIFNLNNRINYYNQLKRNKNKTINTWAVFWYAQIFKNNGLCISPNLSLVNNNGFDKDSTHSHPNFFLNNIYKTNISNKKSFKLPDKVIEDYNCYNVTENFFKKKINYITKFQNLIHKFIKKFIA